MAFRRIKPTSSPDFVFAAVVVMLTIFGFVMLASASSDLAKARFGDSLYYVRHQIVNGLIFGIVGFCLGFTFYYHRWEKIAPELFGITVIFLLLVFTPLGIHTKGSSRWLNLGGFAFQPGELLKLTFVGYLAAWLGKNEKRGKRFFDGFIPFLLLVGFVALLLVKQPSTTIAAILFLVALIMYFAAGARSSFLLGAAGAALLGLAVLIYLTPYRMQRILTFLRPAQVDQLKEGFHINQTLTAIGSGGLFGVGYGKSTTKLTSLPEPIGDSIFAVIGEELGMVGAVTLLLLFFLFVFRSFMIGIHAPDAFGRLLAVGFGSVVGVQTFINIGAISGVLPLTGVPLPFVSYGGTALAVFLTMSGVIINISRYRR